MGPWGQRRSERDIVVLNLPFTVRKTALVLAHFLVHAKAVLVIVAFVPKGLTAVANKQLLFLLPFPFGSASFLPNMSLAFLVGNAQTRNV